MVVQQISPQLIALPIKVRTFGNVETLLQPTFAFCPLPFALCPLPDP